jgi:G protein-coupled receptor GPR1
MLLIQSDMFKALWFMVYPIVTFVNGPVPSQSTFCQVNGFFLALGIEASGTTYIVFARVTLIICRFRNSYDCRPYGTVHISTDIV